MNLNKWKRNLEGYGITNRQFVKEKKELSKKFKKEAPDNDVVWSLFNKLILKNVSDYSNLSGIYYQMAIFLNEEGKDSSEMKGLSAKMKLLYYQQNGVTKVKWIASYSDRTCKKCESLNGKVFLMDEALEKIPLLVKDCRNLDDGCRCCWVAVIEL